MVQVVRDGRARARLIRTAGARGGKVEVIAGLDEGDVILAQPARN
jgi:hypothetical protein